MSNSKKLQVRIDEYAYGVWFDVVEINPISKTVVIFDTMFGNEVEFQESVGVQYREVAVKE